MSQSPLGRDLGYPDTLSPDLLHAIARADGRAALPLSGPLPFTGGDRWTAWELSWLDARGRPVVAVLDLELPADSPNLVESKSLKLYLGSFAMTTFASAAGVRERIRSDLEKTVGSHVTATVTTAAESTTATLATLPGDCIDTADVDCNASEVEADLLQTRGGNVAEALHSHALRSLCPVTGQPDLGSLLVDYRGPRIEPAGLLAYLASFRRHADFHELCVERIFLDILERCRPEALTVYARYNRRGGIDLNPWRTNAGTAPPTLRLWRQ